MSSDIRDCGKNKILKDLIREVRLDVFCRGLVSGPHVEGIVRKNNLKPRRGMAELENQTSSGPLAAGASLSVSGGAGAGAVLLLLGCGFLSSLKGKPLLFQNKPTSKRNASVAKKPNATALFSIDVFPLFTAKTIEAMKNSTKIPAVYPKSTLGQKLTPTLVCRDVERRTRSSRVKRKAVQLINSKK